MDNTKEALKKLSENLAVNIEKAKIPADEFYLYNVIDALQNAIQTTIENLGE